MLDSPITAGRSYVIVDTADKTATRAILTTEATMKRALRELAYYREEFPTAAILICNDGVAIAETD